MPPASQNPSREPNHNSRNLEPVIQGPSTSGQIQALQRGVAVLLSFDSEHREWSLGELTEHVGLRRTTTFRLLKTLQAQGLISAHPSGKYTLGPAVFRMAYMWISEAELAEIAVPHLERLTDATGETTNLVIWSGTGPLCIAQCPTPRYFAPRLSVGRTFSDLANTDTKILLAFGPEERRASSLAQRINRLTPFTITDQERMAEELNRVADEGVAYDVQEQHLGVCAAGVPIWDFSGHLRASLSVVMPEERSQPLHSRTFLDALRQMAAALSYDLGYRGDFYRPWLTARPTNGDTLDRSVLGQVADSE